MVILLPTLNLKDPLCPVTWAVVYPESSYKISLTLYNGFLNCYVFFSKPAKWSKKLLPPHILHPSLNFFFFELCCRVVTSRCGYWSLETLNVHTKFNINIGLQYHIY